MTENYITTKERKWFTMLPNMIDDMKLDPYAFRLYCHLRRVAGEDGACWQNAHTLATACCMSTGSVSKAKKTLRRKGLVYISDREKSGGTYHHIEIVDIWALNFEHFSTPSSSDRPQSQDDRPQSPGDTKKNHVRRTHEEEARAPDSNSESKPSPQEKKGDLLDLVKRFSDQRDDNNRQAGYGEATESEYRICERVAMHWTDNKLKTFSRDIERAIAGANALLDQFNDNERALLRTIDEYHASGESDGLNIHSPYSLRNVLSTFKTNGGRAGGGAHPGDRMETLSNGKRKVVLGQ